MDTPCNEMEPEVFRVFCLFETMGEGFERESCVCVFVTVFWTRIQSRLSNTGPGGSQNTETTGATLLARGIVVQYRVCFIRGVVVLQLRPRSLYRRVAEVFHPKVFLAWGNLFIVLGFLFPQITRRKKRGITFPLNDRM